MPGPLRGPGPLSRYRSRARLLLKRARAQPWSLPFWTGRTPCHARPTPRPGARVRIGRGAAAGWRGCRQEGSLRAAVRGGAVGSSMPYQPVPRAASPGATVPVLATARGGRGLILSTQAAETRLPERSRGQTRAAGGEPSRNLRRGAKAWLPQETILYEGCALDPTCGSRSPGGAAPLMVEPVAVRPHGGWARRCAPPASTPGGDHARRARCGLFSTAVAAGGRHRCQLPRPGRGGWRRPAALVLVAPAPRRILGPGARPACPATGGASSAGPRHAGAALLSPMRWRCAAACARSGPAHRRHPAHCLETSRDMMLTPRERDKLLVATAARWRANGWAAACC